MHIGHVLLPDPGQPQALEHCQASRSAFHAVVRSAICNDSVRHLDKSPLTLTLHPMFSGMLVQFCVCRQGEDAPPARVIVFADSEQQAAAIAEPLRNVLWGEHSIAVLLPGGQEPIQVRDRVDLVQFTENGYSCHQGAAAGRSGAPPGLHCAHSWRVLTNRH